MMRWALQPRTDDIGKRGIRKDTGKILDLVKEYECDTIVIGLPKNWTEVTASRPKKSMSSAPCWKTR